MNSSSGTLLSESESFKCLIYNDVEIIRCYLEYVLGMEIMAVVLKMSMTMPRSLPIL